MLYVASNKSSDNSELATRQPQNSLPRSSNNCGCFTLCSYGIVTRRFLSRLLKHLFFENESMFFRNNRIEKLSDVKLLTVIPRGLNDPEVIRMGHPEALAEGSPNLYVTQVTRNSADKIFTIEGDSSQTIRLRLRATLRFGSE